MAQYDDWVYERGLENEDWVHDRWGDDDWDDDYDGYQDKGEDEDMEQIGNRISFVKGYTKAEKIAINTKIDRILKELSDMQLGPCSFKLSEEITCIYCQNSFHYSSDKTMGLTFKYKDYDENDSEYRNGHYDTYSAKSLFITEYERRLRQDLLNARKIFDLDEKSVFDITYTRADGMDAILEAKNAGVDIDLTPYLELPDLTEDEIESFVKAGYGYDYYLTFKDEVHYGIECGYGKQISSYDDKLKRSIARNIMEQFDGNTNYYLGSKELQKLYDWIEKNPEKCLLPENRHPERTEDMQEEEEKEM